MDTDVKKNFATQIIVAVIAGFAGVLAGPMIPITEWYLGKTVPVSQLEEANKRTEDANKRADEATRSLGLIVNKAQSEKQASEVVLAEAQKTIAEANSATALIQDNFNKLNKVFEENKRAPQIERIAHEGEFLFAGTDLLLGYKVRSAMAGQDLIATVEHDGKSYRALQDRVITVVTKQGRNCEIRPTSVNINFGVFLVTCKATQ